MNNPSFQRAQVQYDAQTDDNSFDAINDAEAAYNALQDLAYDKAQDRALFEN